MIHKIVFLGLSSFIICLIFKNESNQIKPKMKMFKHVYENEMLISIKNFMYAKYFNMHYACTHRSQSNSKTNPYFYLNIIYVIIKSQSNCKEELMCYLFPYILQYRTFKIHSSNVEWNCLLISHFKEKLAEYILFQ